VDSVAPKEAGKTMSQREEEARQEDEDEEDEGLC